MTDLELEIPDCPLCGSSQRKRIYAEQDGGPYGVCNCTQCGMAYLAPRASERQMLSLYQNDDYFTGGDGDGYESYSDQEEALRRTFRRLLTHLEKRGKTGGSLLEIGCGFGYLLDEARPFFSHRVGTDYSANAVRHSRQFADQICHGGVEAVPQDERFDCVIATHVIEHVYRPRDFVEALVKKLKPGGTLLIAAPDFGSFWRKIMGNRWPSFKFPEHVLYFDAHTLSRLMKECGLSSVEDVPYPHAFPLPLIASKFGVKLSGALGQYNMWLPATTVACIGENNA
jgi:SAM-dependent methyltransferase